MAQARRKVRQVLVETQTRQTSAQNAGEGRNGPYVCITYCTSGVCSVSRRPTPHQRSYATSALIEENVWVRATPFLAALLVLSNDNAKAHARAPIAVLAGYAKS